MPTSAATLRFFRQLHRYLGLFIAPALIFFALTGALQTLSLHESSKGSSYKPTAFLATMAQIHKNQTWMLKKPQPIADKGDKTAKSADSSTTAKTSDVPPAAVTALPTAKWKMHLPLKLFFLLVSLGLLTSTTTGIYMAFRYGGSKRTVVLWLLAGAVAPLLLLPF